MANYADELDAIVEASGLKPICARLEQEDETRDEEIPWYVTNKDSNIYVLWIVLPNDAYIGITRSAGDHDSPDGWLLNFYLTEETYTEATGDAVMLGDEVTGDRAVALIDAHLYPEQTRARITSVSEATLNRGHGRPTNSPTTEQDAVFDGLIESRNTPNWLHGVRLSSYLSDEVDDLILLACTYPAY